MQKTEWIELWLLNELAAEQWDLWPTLRDPFMVTGSRWLFPDETIRASTLEERKQALLRCVHNGWVVIYPKQWRMSLHCDLPAHLAATDQQIMDDEYLDVAYAVLTKSGHDHWEQEFAPDWNRLWRFYSNKVDEETSDHTFEIWYASDDIFEELKQWLPECWGFDSEIGMTEISRGFVPCVKVTAWKILQHMKFIEWKASDWLKNENRRRLREVAKTPDRADEFSAEFLRKMSEHGIRQKEAANKLWRLSTKWVGDPFR